MLTLGIETSCDETAAAVLRGEGEILSSVISSQVREHAKFGGIVPEIAARRHAEVINHIIAAALDEAGVRLDRLDLIAVTVGPGLSVSLVSGIACARALGEALGVPVMGVNHLEAHLMSNFLTGPLPELPAVCLLVSGGHTEIIHIRAPGDYEMLGCTRDDAAGEAFDKVARVLGLGYPGGPAIQQAVEAAPGPPVPFPRPMLQNPSLEFSFSGLKTAVIQHLKTEESAGRTPHPGNVAAGFQDAAVDVLVKKTLRAAARTKVKTVLLCGGVSANSALRAAFARQCQKKRLDFHSPPLELCTDNAAMVARAGLLNHSLTKLSPTLSPIPNMNI